MPILVVEMREMDDSGLGYVDIADWLQVGLTWKLLSSIILLEFAEDVFLWLQMMPVHEEDLILKKKGEVGHDILIVKEKFIVH